MIIGFDSFNVFEVLIMPFDKRFFPIWIILEVRVFVILHLGPQCSYSWSESYCLVFLDEMLA